MTLQRSRIIVEEAKFEPGAFVSEVRTKSKPFLGERGPDFFSYIICMSLGNNASLEFLYH